MTGARFGEFPSALGFDGNEPPDQQRTHRLVQHSVLHRKQREDACSVATVPFAFNHNEKQIVVCQKRSRVVYCVSLKTFHFFSLTFFWDKFALASRSKTGLERFVSGYDPVTFFAFFRANNFEKCKLSFVTVPVTSSRHVVTTFSGKKF